MKKRTCWAEDEIGGTLRVLVPSEPLSFWTCLGCGHMISHLDRREHGVWHLRKRGLALESPRRRWWQRR